MIRQECINISYYIGLAIVDLRREVCQALKVSEYDSPIAKGMYGNVPEPYKTKLMTAEHIANIARQEIAKRVKEEIWWNPTRKCWENPADYVISI